MCSSLFSTAIYSLSGQILHTKLFTTRIIPLFRSTFPQLVLKFQIYFSSFAPASMRVYFAIYSNFGWTNERHSVCLLPIYASDRFKLMEIINKQNDWPAAVVSMMLETADIVQTHTCGCRMQAHRKRVGVCGAGKRMSMVLFSSSSWTSVHRRWFVHASNELHMSSVLHEHKNSNSNTGNGIVCVVVDDDNLQTGC